MRKSIAAIAVALSLAACSSNNGNGQAGGDSKSGDACGLLTDEQINQAAQLAAKQHAPIPNNPLSTCKWDLNGENNFVKIYSGETRLFAVANGDALPGLGDKAVWDTGARKVQATKGTTTFEVWIQLFNQQDHEEAAVVALANDVAAKLGWGGGAKVPAATGASKPSTTGSASATKTKGSQPSTTDSSDETPTGKTTESESAEETTQSSDNN